MTTLLFLSEIKVLRCPAYMPAGIGYCRIVLRQFANQFVTYDEGYRILSMLLSTIAV